MNPLRSIGLCASLCVALLAGCAGEMAPEELASSTEELSACSKTVPGTFLSNAIHQEIESDPVLWEQGRRSIEYRSNSVTDFKVSVSVSGNSAKLTITVPRIRIKGKFIRDRIIGADKVRDVRFDLLDTTVVAHFDIAGGVSRARLKDVDGITIRDVDFEGEGLILATIGEIIAQRREGSIRNTVEKELDAYVRREGVSLLKALQFICP
jgi:hypothetical protein